MCVGGAVAADSISLEPKGAARTEGSLLPATKKGFHFAIVEVIPEPCPMSPPPPPFYCSRTLAKIVTCNRKDLSALVPQSSVFSGCTTR